MKMALQAAVEYSHLGYGTFGVCLANGLRNIDVDLWTPGPGEYATVVPSDAETVVWASVPGHATGKWDGQHTVLFSMFETTLLPEGMRSRLHNFDLIVVPNDSNVDLFQRCHRNVVKVPLGYDTNVWTYTPPPPPTDTFRFLFCGAGAAEKSRKGSDVAIAAFRSAFPKWETMSPSPRLVVKCLRFPPEPAPFLEAHAGVWPVEQLADLYRTCHAMVLPSRGEGWGYHPQQAVASGMPAIVSEIPGHMEYAHLPGFATVPVTLSKAGRFLMGESGDWWEPDLDATVDAMRDVYDNYTRWTALAEEGARRMRLDFSPERMARNLVDAIGPAHLGRNTESSPKWRLFTDRLFPLEVNRRLLKSECTVGETSYEFHPGERYWVTCHVKQVIIDAGYAANADEYHPGVLAESVAA